MRISDWSSDVCSSDLKGQFVVFDKVAARLVGSIILPVPTDHTKGIVLCRTAYGNVLVGPTTEDQESREDASTDSDPLRILSDKSIAKRTALTAETVSTAYSGLNQTREHKDSQLSTVPNRTYMRHGRIPYTHPNTDTGADRRRQ